LHTAGPSFARVNRPDRSDFDDRPRRLG
jgi:hypothetical protein